VLALLAVLVLELAGVVSGATVLVMRQ
jgi:hypothetical protein